MNFNLNDPRSYQKLMQALQESADEATTTVKEMKELSERYEETSPIVSALLCDQIELLLRRVELARTCQNVLQKVKTYALPPETGQVMCGEISKQMYEINQQIIEIDDMLRAVFFAPKNIEA